MDAHFRGHDNFLSKLSRYQGIGGVLRFPEMSDIFFHAVLLDIRAMLC
jgi:hypothetical protein